MEMHAIQSKQASMSSGCIVANPDRTAFLGDYFRIAGHPPAMRKTGAPKNLWDAHTECIGNLMTIKIARAICVGAQDVLCILKRSRHRGPKLIDSLRSLNRPRLKIGA